MKLLIFLQNLTKEGKYFVGPCPICGGTDRFSVHQQTARIYCRNCQPGGQSTEARQAFHALMQKITPPTARHKTAQSNQHRNQQSIASELSSQQRAQRLFNAGQPIKGTYAQQWLAKQRAITVDSTKLRYHPAIYHKDLATRYPCSVSSIRSLQNR